METKHTPGPWGSPSFKPKTICSASGLIADCDMSGHRSGEENIANARLIKAAPDLLEALEEILNTVPGNSEDPVAKRYFQYLETVAKAAIAKATGE